jgi:prevent-host-death family protein
MPIRIPAICPISVLAQDARALIAELGERQEPIVITQRGREVAVLLPVDLYRELANRVQPLTASPRLFRPGDGRRFEMEMTVEDG